MIVSYIVGSGIPVSILKEEQKNSITTNQNQTSDSSQSIIEKTIEYFNKKTGKRLKPSSKTAIKHLDPLIAKGYEFVDFKAVIDLKYSEWGHVPAMAKYLRVATLFGQHNFKRYNSEVENMITQTKTTANEI